MWSLWPLPFTKLRCQKGWGSFHPGGLIATAVLYVDITNSGGVKVLNFDMYWSTYLKKIYIFYRMTNETTYETLTTELRGAMQEFFGYLSVRFSFIFNWCYPNFIFLFLIVIIIRLDQKYLSKQFRDKWITTIQTYQY